MGVERRRRDYERLPETLQGLHFLAFAILLLARFVALLNRSADETYAILNVKHVDPIGASV